ncbi:NADH:flavin oxidoreductase/NADH oxidase [Rugamonas sp.]|uniref:NADH:flavin oxidoreductase/NADH oxidase n=1 Tax=Rugamonas sp. TaxID=1926287 RepID=UPI0025FEB05C|nr:NADH:flavin oxidoreductase/NADH oxidase [Rugamonas sp.]
MSQLFSPYALGPLQLKNRIAVAPMCQYSAHDDGSASDWHMIHLGHLALSGAGVLNIEATSISAQARITAADLGLYSDANEAALRKVVQAIRRHASIPLIVQLSHAGRKASTQIPWQGGALVAPADGGWQTVAPSALPYTPGDAPPTALDAAGMAQVKRDFVAAAQRVRALGVNGIELHAAHGYLLHQFLSPLSNVRDDEYGGSLENRMRFPLEVFEAVRAAVPKEMALGVRISATDWVDGGWEIEQSVRFSQELKQRGTDFMHVSSGGLSPLQKIAPGPGYQMQFAARIKRETGLTPIGVGMITEAEHAESIIVQGEADMVALARAMLYDPRWPWHAAARLGAQVQAPPQYLRSAPHGSRDLFAK